MVFTTHLFIFYYLPLVLGLYYALPFRARTGMLALVSYGFYGWASPPWALIMLASTLIDYACGLVLARQAGIPLRGSRELPVIPRERPRTGGMKLVLAASVTSNLLLLAFFKYFNFAAENAARLAHALGMGDGGAVALYVALPVGISFYTFQSMSYAIDVYRGEAPPMRSFTDFCCFEALFPQLVAGPIVRYADVAQQLKHRTHSSEKFARGVAFFAVGMAKKILLANPLGHVADAAFGAAPGALHWYDAWFGVVAYAFQIYFDFSGYSDMAVGLGLMMGFLFIQNFNAPYQADSITDFWRRWHISLSTWLRDYLYIPLGGNRKGPSRTYVNLMLVMLIGGLWHGASWTFVVWGGIHGVMLVVERLQGKDSAYRALPRPVRVGVTFAIVCVAWVFFRAPTLKAALAYLGSMFALAKPAIAGELAAAKMYTPYHGATFLAAAFVCWMLPNSWAFTRTLSPARAAVVMSLLVMSVLAMWTQTTNPFLYFQF
jgi:alginate O-acetyltransferase complex protein AlgI